MNVAVSVSYSISQKDQSPLQQLVQSHAQSGSNGPLISCDQPIDASPDAVLFADASKRQYVRPGGIMNERCI